MWVFFRLGYLVDRVRVRRGVESYVDHVPTASELASNHFFLFESWVLDSIFHNKITLELIRAYRSKIIP